MKPYGERTGGRAGSGVVFALSHASPEPLRRGLRRSQPARGRRAAAGAGSGHAAGAASVDFTRDIEPIFRRTATSATARPKARGRLRLHIAGFDPRGRRHGAGHRPGQERRQLLDSSHPRAGRRRSDAARSRSAAGGGGRAARAWIDQGARMPATIRDDDRGRGATPINEHWAYVKPERPDAAGRYQPRWARNPIDRFVLARLERERLAAVRRGDEADAAPPRDARPHRPAADAGRARRVPRRHVARRVRDGSSIACSPRRTTASAGRGRGSTSRATPTPTATRRTTGARSGSTATGSSTRSTATCRSTSSRSSRSPATCCRTPRPSRRSPPASTATR